MLSRAFNDARLVENGTEIYHLLDYGGDELEIHYPDCDTTPIPEELLSTARRACIDIRGLDNSVQEYLQKEAAKSELDPRDFMLCIGYIKVYIGRIEIRYWGIIVNTEWEAEFALDNTGRWSAQNFDSGAL